MRSVVLLLGVAALALAAASVVLAQLSTPSRLSEPRRLVETELARFADEQRAAGQPPVVVDLGRAFHDRRDLVDPASLLPTWHRYPRSRAALAHRALLGCSTDKAAGEPGDGDAPLEAPALRKALGLHRWLCRGPGPGSVEEGAALLARPPWVSPGGGSFAAWVLRQAGVEGRAAVERAAEQGPVLLLAELGDDDDDPVPRELRRLSGPNLSRILAGHHVVLDDAALVQSEPEGRGLPSLVLFDRGAWEAFARRSFLALEPRRGAGCEVPASPGLCWTLRPPPRLRAWALGTGVASATCLAALAAAALLALRRARREDAAWRQLTLRTLAHELRTPATALGLEVDGLLADLDTLPEGAQDRVLRVGSAVARLQRTVHVTGRYLRLFDDVAPRRRLGRAARDHLVHAADVDLAELATELADLYPGLVVVPLPPGTSARTDPEWLRVIAANLVENAFKHGATPVQLALRPLDGGGLSLSVTDAGASEDLRLDEASRAFWRASRASGLGLGLAIAARAAAALGGRLTHRSAPTTFAVELPPLPPARAP